MTKITPITPILFGSVLLLLTACGGSGSGTNGAHNDNNNGNPVVETPFQKALGIIKNYAKSGGVSLAPTIQTYQEAGISGVSSEQLSQLNSIIASLNADAVDTAEEIQVILNQLDNNPDADFDHDGIPDAQDNCAGIPNPGQTDSDGDGSGDRCDLDNDQDGVMDSQDNCPNNPNPDQKDSDNDGQGDACDSGDNTPDVTVKDKDNDGIEDGKDNCPATPNSDQKDSDNDGLGDVCDSTPSPIIDDDDGDGVKNNKDNCPYNSNPAQQDSDKDGIGDVCDEGISPLSSANFEDRCGAPGVLLCEGFDSAPPTGLGVDASDRCSMPFKEMAKNAANDDPKDDCQSNTGVAWRYLLPNNPIPKSDLPLPKPYNTLVKIPTMDSNVKTSGDGSLMFVITQHMNTGKGKQTQNPDGGTVGMYRANFSTDRNIRFGPGHEQQHFYLQFRWRGSSSLTRFEDPLPDWVLKHNENVRSGKVKGQIIEPGDPRRYSAINCFEANNVNSCKSKWSNSGWKMVWVQPADHPDFCAKFGNTFSVTDGLCRRPTPPCNAQQLIWGLDGYHPNVMQGFHNCSWYAGYEIGRDKQPGGENECITRADGTYAPGCVTWQEDVWTTLKFRYDIGPNQEHCGKAGTGCNEPPKSRIQVWAKVGDQKPIKFMDYKFYNRGPIVPLGLLPDTPNYSGMSGSGTKEIVTTSWKNEGNGVYSTVFVPKKETKGFNYAGWNKKYLVYDKSLPKNKPAINGYAYDKATTKLYVNLGGNNPNNGEIVVGNIGAAETYPDAGYGRVDIYPQIWLKDWRNYHPAMFMWIDELIVSKEDIAWPKD